MTFRMTRPATEWVTTPEAERILGIKRDRLKRGFRYVPKDPNNEKKFSNEQGFLREDIHWKRGPFDNSLMTWNIPKCIEALQAKGFTFEEVES